MTSNPSSLSVGFPINSEDRVAASNPSLPKIWLYRLVSERMWWSTRFLKQFWNSRLLCKVAKSAYQLRDIRPSVSERLLMERSREIWYWEILKKNCPKKQIWLKSDINTGHFTGAPNSFMLPVTLKRHKMPTSSKKSGCQRSRWGINAPQCYTVRKIHCLPCYHHFTTIIVTSVRSYRCSSHEKDKILQSSTHHHVA